MLEDTLKFVIMFSGLWGLIGIILLVVGIFIINNRKRKEEDCTVMTNGIVKDISKRNDCDYDNVYTTRWNPVFEYKVGEETYIKEASYGSSRSKYAVGQKVEIYYNPEDHNEYYIVGETLPKTVGMVFSVSGVGAILIAVISAIVILL